MSDPRTTLSEQWKLITVAGPHDPVHRESFADPEQAIAEREYWSAVERWPKDGAVYLLDPQGVRKKSHDPSGIL